MYVGKAKNLAKRVPNYTRYEQLTPKIQKLVTTATEVRFEVLESELEALLIEAELIRVHQPPFNTLLKDDKSPLYVQITHEDFPKVVTLRRNETQILLTKKPTILGPFPSGYKLQEVLRIARRIFPWCNQGPASHPQAKACFYHHLDLCPGVCIGAVTATAYQAQMQHLAEFLRGRKKTVIKQLIQDMRTAADQEQYELAATLKHQIQLITEVTSQHYRLSPDLVLPSFQIDQAAVALIQLKKLINSITPIPKTLTLQRIEGFDVSNNQGMAADVSMVVFTDGQPDTAAYRLFNIRELNTPNDYAMLGQAITRRQAHQDWPQPDLVVIDGGKGQLKAAWQSWVTARPLMISIAKDPDRILVPISQNHHITTIKSLNLPPDHPALKLVAQVRDESHRFAKRQHHRLLWKQKLPQSTQSVVF